MDRGVIEHYAVGGPLLRRSVGGLSRDDLTARPGPGAWSVLEVVIHLADSDAIAIDRMKRILIEDNPTLLYADESAYVARLFTHEQSLEDALTLFEVGRQQFAHVLRMLPDEAFARKGTHNRKGEVTLGGMVADYVEHLDYHIGFIHAKTRRPMPSGGAGLNRSGCGFGWWPKWSLPCPTFLRGSYRTPRGWPALSGPRKPRPRGSRRRWPFSWA